MNCAVLFDNVGLEKILESLILKMPLKVYKSLGRSIKKSFKCSKYEYINLTIEITAVLGLILSQVFQIKKIRHLANGSH